MTTGIHLTAYPDRQGRFIFVGDPAINGRYIRTDRSVVLVECKHCGARVGEPCKASTKMLHYTGTTHYQRRKSARALHGSHLVLGDDELCAADRKAEGHASAPAHDPEAARLRDKLVEIGWTPPGWQA